MLDLAHNGPPSDAGASQVNAAATARLHERHDSRDREGGESEPKEGGRGLSFAATLFAVRGAVGDEVAFGVVL